jgi:5-methylcytosine-specific restriction endonuclease McrA
MREQILKLRQEGKTYNEIKKILGCSKATISYYCGEGQKEKLRNRTSKLRDENPVLRKIDNFKNNNKKLVANKSNDFQYNESNQKYEIEFGWRDVIEKFGWITTCYLTGDLVDLNLPNTYSFDHVIPRSKGGSSGLDNLGVTTQAANQAKSNLLLHELFELCKKILENNGYKVEKI